MAKSIACTHPPDHIDRSRYIADGRRALRVERCKLCGRIVRRVRSRWKSRFDRWSKLDTIGLTGRARRRSWQYSHRVREQQEAEAKRRKRLQDPVARLIDAMRATEADARGLPQDDDRVWKYHPVARKWRRLMRRWWELSARGLNMYVPKDEIPRSMRNSVTIDRVGSAPDVQHGRDAKIARLKRQAVNVAPGRYWIEQLDFSFVVYAEVEADAGGSVG